MGLSGPRTWPGPPDSKRSGGRSQGSECNEAGRAETGGGVAGGLCCREGVTVTSAGGWQEAVGQLLGRELGEKPRAGISPVSLPPLLLLLTVMSAQSSRVSMTFSCLDCPPRVVYQTLESSGFLLLEGGATVVSILKPWTTEPPCPPMGTPTLPVPRAVPHDGPGAALSGG